RHDVVENESTFVEGGEKVAAERAIAEIRRGNEDNAEAREYDGMFERTPHRTLVDGQEPLEKRVLRRVHMDRLTASDQARAEVARPDEGEHQRGEQRDAHGDRQGAEERS